MSPPTVEVTLVALVDQSQEPFRGLAAPPPPLPDRIAVEWKAVDPALHARALAGVIVGVGLFAAAAVAAYFDVALFVLGAVAGVASVLLGYFAQRVQGRVDGDDAWLIVRGDGERRIYLPDVTSFDWMESGDTVHAVVAVRDAPPVIVGNFASIDEARAVLAPLRAHWHRVREAPIADAPVTAPSVPAVRPPRGLRARRHGAALILGRPWYALTRRLLRPTALVWIGLAIRGAAEGSLVEVGFFLLFALVSLTAPRSDALSVELADGVAILRGQATTVRAALSRLASLEVDSDGTIRAALRGGGHVAVPALPSPRDAPYLAQELGATLGIPVVAPALPAGPAVPALPAGDPSSAT